MGEAILAEEYRPFLYPGYGWLVILPNVYLLFTIFSGQAARYMRPRLRPSAIILGVQLGIGIVASGAGIVGGVGLLLESESLVMMGSFVFVAAVAAATLIGTVYRRPDGPEPYRW